MKPTSFFSSFRFLLFAISCVFVVMTSSSCVYMKMLPPADIDKRLPGPPGGGVDNSCWMATASNMLAGAGYGAGATLDARAEDIYADMVAHYGKGGSGWIDNALDWWLSSSNNTWTTNPYKNVTVYGNKTKIPWANTDGAMFIANELRSCHFVGLSISWPAVGGASGGHAITAWGDNMGENDQLKVNAVNVRVTDSDTDNGGDVQAYNYDQYTNPNPGGANQGNGWYFNYDANHPFIKHICTLSAIDESSGNDLIQKVVGSYKIMQENEYAATGLAYKVGTDVNILSYRTYLDWEKEAGIIPAITEASPRTSLDVTWDLSSKPIPAKTWVTITTEFILPSWNAMYYNNVHFTYPLQYQIVKKEFPKFNWKITTPPAPREALAQANATGGYVVGSVQFTDPQANNRVVGEYRFIHQYSYTQSPESHILSFTGQNGYEVRNFRFGHSYGYLDAAELWKFENWMTQTDRVYRLSDNETRVEIDWRGKLPYPEGEDIRGRIPKKNSTEKEVINWQKTIKRKGN